jgi:hypothetical protein
MAVSDPDPVPIHSFRYLKVFLLLSICAVKRLSFVADDLLPVMSEDSSRKCTNDHEVQGVAKD